MAIHEKNQVQTQEQQDFLADKFTSEELYQWMLSQLAGVYFQSYRLAYDLARSAEKAFQYERNNDESYIHFGHWDSLKKGLMAGELLLLELSQLDKAFLEQNTRTFEIERTVPLSQLPDISQNAAPQYPSALLALKANGACEFSLSNTLFETDYPGHYARQIKSVSISVPAILGPYEQLKATLTQLSNSVLVRPNPQALNVSNVPAQMDHVELDPGAKSEQHESAGSGGYSGRGSLSIGSAENQKPRVGFSLCRLHTAGCVDGGRRSLCSTFIRGRF